MIQQQKIRKKTCSSIENRHDIMDYDNLGEDESGYYNYDRPFKTEPQDYEDENNENYFQHLPPMEVDISNANKQNSGE
jgi:hypothetical protein